MAMRASVPSVGIERLSRAARCAGEVFGYEESEALASPPSRAGWLWGAIGLAAAFGFVALALD